MDNCSTCKNMIWDELWGEFKCSVLHRRMYVPLSAENCDSYIKDKTKEDKDVL